jgi:hypothetical protein
MFIKKKIIKIFIFIFIFLAPISFSFESNPIGTNFNNNESIAIDVSINQAYAITTGNCGNFLRTPVACIQESILSVYELLIFYTTQIILVLVGLMFDMILFFSLDGNFYRSGLMEAGWEILRDFTNIIFIFALLIISFKLVLGQDDGKTKGTLVKTILIALTINFSLFLTYIVIDSSNILAQVFYNRIDVTGNYNVDNGENSAVDDSLITSWIAEITEGQKSISLAIASKINPQKIIQQSGSNDFLQAFIIVTTAGIMNILLAYVFLSLLLLFLGRSLGLMVSGILAPLAFASLTIPSMQGLPYVGFSAWLKELVSLAFMAPVFMFFMYIIVTFLSNEGFLASLSNTQGQGFLAVIMSTYMFFLIIGGLLFLAKKITTSMAGNLGSMAAQGVAGITGVLAGAAAVGLTGGVALAGRGIKGTANVFGAKDADGKLTGKWAKRVSRFGGARLAFKADVTKIPGFKAMANASGMSNLGDKIGQVTGVSARDISNKAKYAGTAVVAGTRDILSGRAGAEEEVAQQKKRDERRDMSSQGTDGVYGWKRKLNKEKEQVEAKKIEQNAKDAMDKDGGVIAQRVIEQGAATAVLENPDIIKEETKAIEGLEDSIKNLTAQYNAAKGMGNTPAARVAAAQIQEEMNIEKLRLDARKKGIEISTLDMEGHVISNYGANAQAALDSEKLANKNKFGTTTTYKGVTGAVNVENKTYKGKHEYEKQKLHTEEKRVLVDVARDLRPGKEKQADALLKKIDSLLTDSTKERKVDTPT